MGLGGGEGGVVSLPENVKVEGSSAPGRQLDLFPLEEMGQVRQDELLGSSRAGACWSPRPHLGHGGTSPLLPWVVVLSASPMPPLPTTF